MFYNCTSLANINISNLQSITSGQYVTSNMFYGCTATSIDLSNLTTINIGTYGCQNWFSNSKFQTIDLSNLNSITAPSWGFTNAFNITTLRHIKLGACRGGMNYNSVITAFSGATNLTELTINPTGSNHPCYTTSGNFFIKSLTRITTLHFTNTPNTTLNFGLFPLSKDSVIYVLTECDNANMNGKSITFKAGLTVTDDAEGSIAALKASVVARGCTVNNLTINPYTP
jgi:hypothetical protein